MTLGKLLPLMDAREGAVDLAQRYIASLLDLRRFRPGDRLPPAADLAVGSGVSRPAVLQALKILSTQGRVTVKPGRGGVWVTEHEAVNLDARLARAWENRGRILQMAELRTILEPGVARMLAEKGVDASTMSILRKLVDEMGERTYIEIESYRTLDNDFHLVMAQATGVQAIENLVMSCRADVAAAFDAMEVPPDRVAQSNEEHIQILDAIAAGDGMKAYEVMLNHVASTAVLLRAELGGSSRPTGKRARESYAAVAERKGK